MSLFLQSYLFSYLFWIDIPLGALPFLMLYYLTGGRWGSSVRKILEALSDTLGIFIIFVLPILIWTDKIYPWMDPEIAAEPRIQHKAIYLNHSTFVIRTVIYFICWVVLNYFLQNWSREYEKRRSIETQAKLRSLSAGGLVLLSLLVTFAGIDWQMSVEPKWYSDVYGMVYGIGQALSSYGFTLIVFGVLSRQTKLESRFPKPVLWDLGNILLTLVMVWAYLSFAQYLIIWSGNLPHEVIWFNHRTHNRWQWPGLLLLLFQFAGPFIVLLFRPVKGTPTRLAILGLLIFLIRIVDHYWMLMPGLIPDHFIITWQAIVTWLGMGMIWFVLFIRRLRKAPLFATNDSDWPITVEPSSEEAAHA